MDKESWIIGGSVLGVFVVLIAALLIGVNALRDMQCGTVAAAMGKPHLYGFNLGCLIKVDDEFIPLSAYKVIR